jgi:hypothetical protein
LLDFERTTPTVEVLVDRSGSMFDLNDSPWSSVRTATLAAIDALDADIDFGFMAMTGELGTCPILAQVAPAPDNYPAIATLYGGLGKLAKGESPFSAGLEAARQALAAAPGSAGKYVVMIIDGDPDYCGDGNHLCAIDAVVGRIQALHAAGIVTRIVALPLDVGSPTDETRYLASLQSYANAGIGGPAAAVGDSPFNIYQQCFYGADTNSAGWKQEFQASGKPANETLGNYSASPASTSYTTIDPASASGMTSALKNVFASATSCAFHLRTGKLDLAKADYGSVKLDNTSLTYGDANGWRLNSQTELELTGTACSTLLQEPSTSLIIDFPCSALAD